MYFAPPISAKDLKDFNWLGLEPPYDPKKNESLSNPLKSGRYSYGFMTASRSAVSFPLLMLRVPCKVVGRPLLVW